MRDVSLLRLDFFFNFYYDGTNLRTTRGGVQLKVFCYLFSL